MELICVTSSTGGCGASFCAANLAKTLSDSGHKCLLSDLCFRNSSLDIILGQTDGFVFNLSDVFKERCDFADAVVKEAYGSNLDFAATSALEQGDDEYCGEILNLLKSNCNEYDYVIVDIPAYIIGNLSSAYFDRIIYVTDSQRSSVTVLERYVQATPVNCPSHIIVNKVVPELIAEGGGVNIDDICDLTGVPLLGIIPWEPEICAYANSGVLSTDDKNLLSSKAFENITERLKGNHVCAVDFEYKTLYYKKIKNITYRR